MQRTACGWRMMVPTFGSLAMLLLLVSSPASFGAAVQLSAEQQKAVDQLKAKGASVMQQAADSDNLVVNLGLAGKAAGDAELALVKGLPKVVELDLHLTGVTDAGLENIAGLTTLTRLRLDQTKVGDVGVAHLKGLSNLTYINLYDTQVSDASLDTLKSMKGLKRIYVWQSKVSEGGADALRKALPEAIINRGEGMAALAAVPPPPAPETAKKPDKPDADKPGKPINTVCPVSGKPVDDTKLVVYQGQTIGFCCDMCPEKFKKEPTKYISKVAEFKPAAAAAKPDDKKPDDKKPDDKKPAAAADASKPDDEGFIRSWLLLAPIPLAEAGAGATEIDKQQVANEKDLKPKAGDKSKAGDAELTWKAITAKEFFFDINEILGGDPKSDSAAYAVVYIDSADERKGLNLHMCSNDQGKVYLNGKEVVKFTETRGIDKDQDKAEGVTLAKGTNVIVFKVINEQNNWQGAVRFTDKEGKPVKDLKVKLTP